MFSFFKLYIIAFALFVSLSFAQAAPSLLLILVKTESTGRSNFLTLTCDPTGGSHPNPSAACAQLAAVNGNITQIPPTAGVACTLQYDPVSVTVLGTYGGRGISFQQTYGNSCTMGIALGDFL
ncbi:hypothetical protein CU098_011674 [Rhizopus stolonifer]|uniref:Subtilisin inhibitor domain-containing protein n=1 Tax=Rhizopus stolonifer TaxID=4846 RepID=A0A367KB33_RHIST|nr:hypothetical protein CU098_011674 [Rhizopus stolonifer]